MQAEEDELPVVFQEVPVERRQGLAGQGGFLGRDAVDGDGGEGGVLAGGAAALQGVGGHLGGEVPGRGDKDGAAGWAGANRLWADQVLLA